jgi:hypothetical protein
MVDSLDTARIAICEAKADPPQQTYVVESPIGEMRMKRLSATLPLLAAVFAWPASGATAESAPRPLTVDQIENTEKTVTECVEVVHEVKPADPSYTRYYAQFDAFYNAVSGKVETNAAFSGVQPALYVFDKCMAERGIPLS